MIFRIEYQILIGDDPPCDKQFRRLLRRPSVGLHRGRFDSQKTYVDKIESDTVEAISQVNI